MQRAGSGLERVVARALHQMPAQDAPLAAWPLVCGSAVADRTRALEFADGVLQVEVTDNGWKAQLQELAPRYLAEINRYSEDPVKRIEFLVLPKTFNGNNR